MSETGPGREPVRPRHRAGGAARVPMVAVLAGALIVTGLIDRTPGPSRRPAVAVVAPVPVAAPAQALSSSWFCAAATDSHAGSDPAPGAVVIANSGLATATGIVTLIPSQGSTVRIPVSVSPDSRIVVAEDVPHGAPWIGAVADIDAGAVAVEQQIDGPAGWASTPCATAGSPEWYFATGATLINATVGLSLLNPYPTDTVVDLSFTTDQGLEQPPEFQGLVVPPSGLLAVNLGDHLRRRHAIATTVTARSGRLVVAWKTDVVTPPAQGEVVLGMPAAANPLVDPAAPIAGETLTLGAPDAATRWTWPDGMAGNGVTESYVIYNPGTGIANLRLSIDLDQGVAEPFDLSVGPDQVTTVVSSQEVRIPPGVGHSAVLESVNGVPVVAERTISAASSSRSGLGELPGGQVAAARWLLVAGQADRSHDGWVVLYNPGSTTVQAVLEGLSGRAQVALDTVTILPGRRAAIHLNQLRPILDEPLVVSASAPVYAESDFYGQDGTPGISLSFGVPLTP